MSEQHFSLLEITALIVYLGSISFLLGVIYQLFLSLKADKQVSLKQLLLIIITSIISILLTLFFWSAWPSTIDIMMGPILLPALLSELILSPVLLKFFGYPI